MKLYKYTSYNIGKEIISTSKIALSPPQTFNDPFDCLPIWSQEDIDKAYDYIFDFVAEKQLIALLEDIKNNLQKRGQRLLVSFVLGEYKLVAKLARLKPGAYRPAFSMKKWLRIIEHHKLSEEQTLVKNELIALSNPKNEKAMEIVSRILDLRNSLYVGCLSSQFDSILMWAYYGQNHKGLCLEIELEDDKEHSFPVVYQEDRPSIKAQRFIEEMCGRFVAGYETEQISKDTVLQQLVSQPYVTKSKEWEHEQEHRLIYTEKELIGKGVDKVMCNDGIERYMFPISKITKVYLGAAMSDKQKAEIYSIIPSEIEVVEMKISDAKYELLTQ
jgi:hypothetical protein